jgi:hypothetical protein
MKAKDKLSASISRPPEEAEGGENNGETSNTDSEAMEQPSEFLNTGNPEVLPVRVMSADNAEISESIVEVEGQSEDQQSIRKITFVHRFSQGSRLFPRTCQAP